MTEVYVVTQGWDYEGEEIIGTFDDSDEARAFAERMSRDELNHVDEYSVYRLKRNSTQVETPWIYRTQWRLRNER